MAQRKNCFDPCLTEFLRRVGIVESVSYFLHRQQGRAEERSAELVRELASFGRRHGASPDFIQMTRIIARDYYNDEHRFLNLPDTSQFVKPGDYVAWVKEVFGRLQATCLVDAFEALEDYVCEFGAVQLWQDRSNVTLTDAKAFKKHLASSKVTPQKHTKPWFRAYAKWKCRRSSLQMLKLLGRQAPTLLVLLRGSSHKPNLLEDYQLFEQLRHQVVHEFGRTTEGFWRRLSPSLQGRIRPCVRKSVKGDEAILLDNEQYKRVSARMTSLAALLYQWASKQHDMKCLITLS